MSDSPKKDTRARSAQRSRKALDKAMALMNVQSSKPSKSMVGKLSAGVSGFFSSSGKSKKGGLLQQAAASAKFPTAAASKGYESVGDEGVNDVDTDTDTDDEYEDPRLRVRQLLGASSGRIVKSVMAQPSAIKKHIKAHADLIADRERQRMDDLKASRAERAKELELDRRNRQEKWLRRQGHGTTPEDDTELQLRLMQEEERRQALKGKKLQDFDAPWHTNTLAGISQVLGELEAEDAPQDGGLPPLTGGKDDEEEDNEARAKAEAEEEIAAEGSSSAVARRADAAGDAVPLPDYMSRADNILSSADATAPLTPWSMAALPDQQVNDDAAAVPYGSQKQKAEENESWMDMLERTKRSLHRDRDKSRQKARTAVGLTSSATTADQYVVGEEEDGPAAVRQDRAASSAEEHRRLPKSEREWSFVPRQKVRNDVLLLAQRTAKKSARGKKK